MPGTVHRLPNRDIALKALYDDRETGFCRACSLGQGDRSPPRLRRGHRRKAERPERGVIAARLR
jgi:hypothetical protein